MATTKFTIENTAVMLAHMKAGGSFAAACREVGVRQKTAEGWLTRGRREDGTPYAEFAAAVEAAREEVAARTLSEADLVRFMERLARKGSFQATKYLLARYGRESDEDEGSPDSGFDALEGDELAPRRAAKP